MVIVMPDGIIVNPAGMTRGLFGLEQWLQRQQHSTRSVYKLAEQNPKVIDGRLEWKKTGNKLQKKICPK